VKCIVTGGSGFIGTHLVDELIRKNYEVLNIDIKPPILNAHIASWKERDILDSEALLEDFQSFIPDYVIHLAARTDTLSDRVEDYAVNTQGTDNVLFAIKACSSVKRVIICSTQFVNQYHGAPKDDLDFAPHTAYGESKVLNEKAVRAANLSCLWTIIRPTNIWGPWHPRYAQEFWRILGKGLYVHPGGREVMRSYGYVKNVVYQVMKMLEAPPELVDKKVYYAGDRPINLHDWVNGFSEGLTGRKVRVVPRFLLRLLAFAGDLLSYVHIKFPLTSSRFRSMTTSNDAPMEPVFDAFGHVPYSLQEGIDETIDWLKINHPEIVMTRGPLRD
jgi:nucleoside-diphosphate-sugar epimerase